jgi:putative transcriptional regulator
MPRMPQPRRPQRGFSVSTPTTRRPWGAARLAVAVIMVALVATTPGRSAEPRAAAANLTGQLLVATSDMPDPRFARTVIYMVRHDADGAQGFVLNRPFGDMPLAVLLEQMRLDKDGVEGTVRLHSGGPVEALHLFVLHTADYSIEGTVSVKDGIALSWEPDIFRAIARGKGPRRALFVLGYAGWGPGQLEAEMKTGAWARAAADEALVFDQGDDSKWDRAMARRKIDL